MPQGARVLLFLGAVHGLISVVMGAFAAHALEGALDPGRLSAFETGARLHLPHAAAIFGVGVFLARLSPTETGLARIAGGLLAAGTTLFAISLYLYGMTGFTPLVFVTPVGGVLLVLGWAMLALMALRLKG